MTVMAGTETPETDTDAPVRRFAHVEDMVYAYHPEWAYLGNVTLPVRPATEEEQAAYEARRTDGSWADLYNPPGPEDVPRPVPAVTDDTPIAVTYSAALAPLPPEPAWREQMTAALAPRYDASELSDAAAGTAADEPPAVPAADHTTTDTDGT